ncbi:MAG: cell wall metabolism sensor histidine kinase WalK [Clostridiales bacterium]|nr:cell wall metabolism sensor histidine kinase WalK [Clostridiales bacterium]
MFRSIQWRLVFIFAVVAIALVIPVGLVLNNRVEAIYYGRFIDAVESGFRNWQINADSTLDDMLVYLRDEMNSLYLFNLDEYKSYTIIDKSDVNNIAHSSDGLFISSRNRFVNEILASPNLLSTLNDAGEGRGSAIVRTEDGRRYYDYARLVPLSDPDAGGASHDYVLYFRYSSEAWSALTGSFSDAILLSSLLAVLIASVSGYLLARTITDPIKRLMNSANRIADGDLDQAVEAKSDDEIGELTRASNKMAKALKANLEEITSEKNKQENILNCSQDGIIAYSMKGEVILSNPAAARRIGEDLAHAPFDEFSEHFGMGRTIAGIQASDEIASWEHTAEYEDQALEIHCSVFSDIANKPGGLIAVVHDVTEQYKLESMRREFVANVSHELRTPLTSIISYSETLLDGGMEDRETAEKFIGVIHSEADRMARLVRELLQLSRFDNDQARWLFSRIDVVMTLRACVDRLQLVAREKSQSMTSYVFGSVPDVWADRDKLEQVFINVIGNALKYTPDYGSITIYVSRMASEVHVKVSDTGIGVPEEDIPRLCERFFRVDKARSRDMGGTGLGLAIASEIVSGHKGAIVINSKLGKGTDVLIRLPINPSDA